MVFDTPKDLRRARIIIPFLLMRHRGSDGYLLHSSYLVNGRYRTRSQVLGLPCVIFPLLHLCTWISVQGLVPHLLLFIYLLEFGKEKRLWGQEWFSTHSTVFEASNLIFPSTKRDNFYNSSYIILCNTKEYHSIFFLSEAPIVLFWHGCIYLMQIVCIQTSLCFFLCPKLFFPSQNAASSLASIKNHQQHGHPPETLL